MSIANPQRIPVTFYAKVATVELAAELGIDVQAVCEGALRAEVARCYAEVNRDAIESINKWVEANGLPLERYRQF